MSKLFGLVSVLALFIGVSCAKKTTGTAATTLTMTCVERSDPNDHTSAYLSCHELTYSSANTGAAIGRCPSQSDIFANKSCAQVASESLATPIGSYLGKCYLYDSVDGLSNPGTNQVIYAYNVASIAANATMCGATGGQWSSDP